MTCRQVHEIDLPGFLAEPGVAGFAAFREHYPVCPECAAELRAWTELHLQLQGPQAHPPPELLLRYEREPGALSGERRAALADHLEACATCADELQALRGFDPARAAAPVPAATRTARSAGPSLIDTLRGWLWQPALAYTLVLLLLVPLVVERWEGWSEAPDEPVVAFEKRQAAEPGPEARQDDEPKPVDPKPRDLLAARAKAPEAPAPESLAVARNRAAGQRSGSKPVLGTLEAAEPAPADPDMLLRGRADLPQESLLEQDERELAKRDTESADAAYEVTHSALRREVAHKTSQFTGDTVAGEAGTAQEVTIVSPELAWTRERGELVVYVPNPALRNDEREIEVRVLHADGRRQLVERVAVLERKTATPVRIPEAWLGSGRHRIEVRIPSDPPTVQRVIEYELLIP